MCRFLVYTGNSVVMDELLYKPGHSLIKQSYHAKEMEEPLNGDGFGIGWYVRNLDIEPGLFTSISPAWNNRNLKYLSTKIESNCIFAHVRAASVGDVSEFNCHPFHYKQFLMMHNGVIDDFEEIKRPLINKLSEERFRWIKGQTDSEHLFALYMDHLLKKTNNPDLNDFCNAFRKTFSDLQELKEKYGIDRPSYLNLMVTDGSRIVGSRFVTETDKIPLSLYCSQGKKYECVEGECRMTPTVKDSEKAILVVSERLTTYEEDWNTVPDNHFLMIDDNLNAHFDPVSF